MYGIRVNSSAVDSPNNNLIKRKENKVTKDLEGIISYTLQDVRGGKLCPETRSSWSEYIMLQSLVLLYN